MIKPNRGKQTLNITDNAECRCFEKPKPQQHYFLLKNRYPKDANPTYKPQHNSSNMDLKQNSSKKSLRKEKSRDYPKQENDRIRQTYEDYYPSCYKQLRTERSGFGVTPLQVKQKSFQHRHMKREVVIPQTNFQPRPPILVKSTSVPFIHPSLNYTQRIIPTLPIKSIEINQPRYLQPQISPRMYASSEKNIYEAAPITPRYKMENILPAHVKARDENRNGFQLNQEVQTQFKIKISEKKKAVQQKVVSDRSIKSKVFEIMPQDKEKIGFEDIKKKTEPISLYKEQPLKLRIIEEPSKQRTLFDRNKLNLPVFQSRIDTKKSCIDDMTGKSKITLKKMKNQKPRLKNMEDVQEIKSMVDSEEMMMSDDDKQSVVLARLNQYGSLVDPAFSADESRPVTFMSKLGRQSTTAEKSMVKGYQFVNYK